MMNMPYYKFALVAVLSTLVLAAGAGAQNTLTDERLAPLVNLQRQILAGGYLYLRGVEGVAFRLENGRAQLIVYVDRNKKQPDLSELFALAGKAGIQSRDPLAINKFKALQGAPAQMGTSTGNEVACTAGTLGIVAKHDGDGVAGYITSAHVATAEKKGLCPNGDEEDQVAPGKLDVMPHCGKSTDIGTLVEWTKIPTNGVDTATVDAAFVAEIPGTVDSKNACGLCPSDFSSIDFVQAAKDKLEVLACGRGSNNTATSGNVEDVLATVWVGYACGIRALFTGQIVVSGKYFSKPGYSGAIAYGKVNGVLGLVFAGNGTQTLVNPMDEVLKALHVTIDTSRPCK